MGAGLAKQIKELYPHIFGYYKNRCKTSTPEALLGSIDSYPDSKNCRQIVNMYAQKTYGRTGVHTDYEALKSCLNLVKILAEAMAKFKTTVKVGLPHGLGCGLAGGDWSIVSGIIEETFKDSPVFVEIWKLEK